MFSYIQAKWRKFLLNKTFRDIIGESNIEEYLGLPKHKKEQIIYRMYILQNHPIGSNCLKKNECPCQCTTSEVILSDGACDKLCFPDMLNHDDWEYFKRINGVTVDLINQKVIMYVNN